MRSIFGDSGVFGRDCDVVTELSKGSRQQILSLAEHRYVSPVHLAQVHLGLGDFDKVFELLEKAFQERDPALRVLIISPAVEELTHGDPRLRT